MGDPWRDGWSDARRSGCDLDRMWRRDWGVSGGLKGYSEGNGHVPMRITAERSIVCVRNFVNDDGEVEILIGIVYPDIAQEDSCR